MKLNAESHKTEFRVTLWPMMELFEHKKNVLNHTEWLLFLNNSRDRIISNPEQFLGKDLPTQMIVQEIVQEIFEEYLEEKNAELLVEA